MQCAHCNADNPGTFRFCGACGNPLAPLTEAKPRGRRADRRQITVAFCDLAGSVELSRRLDPEDLREVLSRYHAVAGDAIERYDGCLAQLLGDGVLAYFGFPQGHEDDACRAVRAGLKVLEGIEGLNAQLEREKGVRIAARVGIHSGLVIAGEMGSGDYRETLAVGETPNIAARLQSIAEPGSVLISAATHRLVRGYFNCSASAPTDLKGISARMETYRVPAETGARDRVEAGAGIGLTTLIG